MIGYTGSTSPSEGLSGSGMLGTITSDTEDLFY